MHPASHALISWLVADARDLPRLDRTLVFAGGLLPDLDGLVILGGTEMYQRWHHVILHNGLSAVVYGVIVGLIATRKLTAGVLAMVTWHLHMLADWMGSGGPDGSLWSIPYLVPFSFHDYYAPFQWPLASWQNVVITLIAIVLCVWLALIRGRTVVDVFSQKADGHVIEVLRRRFGRGEAAPTPPPEGGPGDDSASDT